MFIETFCSIKIFTENYAQLFIGKKTFAEVFFTIKL